MMYGNSSMGYSYSPDRSRDVDRYNYSTRSNYYTNGASGNRQNGYYYSATNKQNGSGEWKQSGSGKWYRD